MSLPRRRLLILAGAGSVLGLSACGPETATEAPPSPASTPTPEELLGLASKRLAETRTVHFSLSVQGETFVDTGRTIRLLGAEGDLRRPDRVRTAFQVEILDRAVSLQLITIGDESWTTNVLTGEWGKAPLEFQYSPDVLFSTQDGIGPVMGRVEGVERLDDDDISGRSTYHLRAAVGEEVVGPLTYETMSGSPVTVDLWLDQETLDLLQATLAESPGDERPDPAVWTLELSHHGEDIAIEPPQEAA